jgi:peptidoglycan/LPS O-acetylase OafA/YrhL
VKTNNLNFLRLIAAGLVLYGHSAIFLVRPEPLFLLWMPLGPLGVAIFFIISGYLVTQSWQQDQSLRRFLVISGHLVKKAALAFKPRNPAFAGVIV